MTFHSDQKGCQIVPNCEFCGIDAEVLCLLPIHQPDGRLDKFACHACAITSGVYCVNHDTPHHGFNDGTHACLNCIEDLTQDLVRRYPAMSSKVQGCVSAYMYERWRSWCVTAADVMRCNQNEAVCRAMATLAMRTATTSEELLERLVAERDITVLIPLEVFDEFDWEDI